MIAQLCQSVCFLYTHTNPALSSSSSSSSSSSPTTTTTTHEDPNNAWISDFCTAVLSPHFHHSSSVKLIDTIMSLPNIHAPQLFCDCLHSALTHKDDVRTFLDSRVSLLTAQLLSHTLSMRVSTQSLGYGTLTSLHGKSRDQSSVFLVCERLLSYVMAWFSRNNSGTTIESPVLCISVSQWLLLLPSQTAQHHALDCLTHMIRVSAECHDARVWDNIGRYCVRTLQTTGSFTFMFCPIFCHL